MKYGTETEQFPWITKNGMRFGLGVRNGETKVYVVSEVKMLAVGLFRQFYSSGSLICPSIPSSCWHARTRPLSQRRNLVEQYGSDFWFPHWILVGAAALRVHCSWCSQFSMSSDVFAIRDRSHGCASPGTLVEPRRKYNKTVASFRPGSRTLLELDHSDTMRPSERQSKAKRSNSERQPIREYSDFVAQWTPNYSYDSSLANVILQVVDQKSV